MIKRIGNYKLNDILYIEWVDQSYHYGPVHLENALNECYGHTVGHFITENKDWLCLGNETFKTTNDGEVFRHILTFPKCAILKIKKLK